KGHPWPIAALATSMSLNPFHGDSTRPPEGDTGVACKIAVREQQQKQTLPNLSPWKYCTLALRSRQEAET
ncbi:hypothetical protein, partial [Pseudomonas sp. Bi70]|uniref:hypothetical protein n=1 Tax=Pseudomonas sp. Bi70 TaxID=2821127 RepID=UPI001E3AA7B6